MTGFARGMIFLAEALVPNLFEEEVMQNLQDVAPDEKDHCAPLAKMRCSQVRRAFGVPASQVSLGACLAGWMHEKHALKILAMKDDAQLAVAPP